MFTGIVEELGTVVSLDGPRLRLEAHEVLGDVTMGASIAVNGCCLTVVAWGDDWWEADVSYETFLRTSLGSLGRGSVVNLERPVRLEDRLGGHLVQGHVDAVGRVVVPAPGLVVEMPEHLMRYVVEKGSITVDGVSLTVVEVLANGFSVALIPHTCEVTTLGRRDIGDLVNLEVDVMAKYAERLLAGHLPAAAPNDLAAAGGPSESEGAAS
jgi:riboflavin synthase